MEKLYDQPVLPFDGARTAVAAAVIKTDDNRYANGHNLVGSGQEAVALEAMALYRQIINEATERKDG